MNDNAQLKNHLKALKLSGILENLDLRLLEAQTNQLAYSEFISALLLDELEARDARKLNRLLIQAHLGIQKTFEVFDFSFNPSINAAQIRELATCRFIDRGENIFFLGPTGTGKTHLAKALCHQACRKYYSTRFYNFSQLFAEIKKADLNQQIEPLLKTLIKVDLLVIDDFAFKKIDPSSAEYLYSIVDLRQQTKSIIITSNRAIVDWLEVFPDPIIANAIMDRLAHHCYQIVIKGESYRKKFSPKLENP